MLKNYLKVTLRTLGKHKAYASINIAGLTIGLACFLLILVYVRHERSYDAYHHKAPRSYRVLVEHEGREHAYATVAAPLAPLLSATYPEIETVVRLSKGWPEVAVSQGEHTFYERDFYFAEAAFFDVFDVELLYGDPSTALSEPYHIILAEKAARKYFGAIDPVGLPVRVEARAQTYDFVVTGVLEALPSNSHLQVDFLASYATLSSIPGRHPGNWRMGAHTYVVLKEGEAPEPLMQKLIPFARTHLDAREQTSTRLALEALTDIHLSARVAPGQEISPPGDTRALYLFSAIGLLILLIACINYANLATARSTLRLKEVGIRKVVGARREQLVAQFLGEALFFTLIALGMALALVDVSLPAFNRLVQKQIAFTHLHGGWTLLGLLGIGGAVGVISGSYPALFLSAFRPMNVLKGKARSQASRAMRNGLVVFQFSIMVTLMGSTVIIQRQLHYIQTKRLGFDQKQVLVLPTKHLSAEGYAQDIQRFKRALLQHTDISQVTTGSNMLGGVRAGGGSLQTALDDAFFVDSFDMDADFLQTMGLELIAGRAFDPNLTSDWEQAVLLNETAVRRLGLEEPLGQPIAFTFSAQPLYVIGVVRDFHNRSLREEIVPAVITLKAEAEGDNRYVALKIQAADVAEVLAYAKAQWETIAPALPFEYSFLSEDLDALYREDQRFKMLFGSFAALALIIACLGLFGLAAFTIVQRQKELGIRKVMGATVRHLVVLLTADFIRLVGVAVAVATPVAYFAMKQWLAGFAYQTTLGLMPFMLVGVFVVIIALLTVGYQSVIASRADPVTFLRHE